MCPFRLRFHVACTAGSTSPTAIAAPWKCTYPYYGCTDPAADNYADYVTILVPSMCQYGGCNDTDAKNYNSVVRFAELGVAPTA